MDVIEKSFTRVYEHEKGFTKNAADPGNWTGGAIGRGVLKGTKFGISAAAYPDVDIENLTYPQALVIFKRDYWDKVGMGVWHPALQYQFFDTAINSGVGAASKMLQQALGVVPDGAIGAKTQAAIRAAEPHALALGFIAERLAYITRLTIWPTFGRGWSVRIAENLRHLAEDI